MSEPEPKPGDSHWKPPVAPRATSSSRGQPGSGEVLVFSLRITPTIRSRRFSLIYCGARHPVALAA